MASDFPTSAPSFAAGKFGRVNNLGKTTLASAITGLPATISITNAAAVTTWPTANFAVRINKADDTQNELVFIASRSGTTLTVGSRGQGGTSAQDHASGDEIRVVNVAEAIEYGWDTIIALAAWSGVLGTMVHANVTSGPYTATANDHIIPADATSGVITVNLPTAVGIKGRRYIVAKVDGTANAVTIDASGSQTIGGQLTYVLYALNQTIVLMSDGANWIPEAACGPLDNLKATTGPVVGDDASDGYSPGSIWVDTTNDAFYICVDSTVGAAVWLSPGMAWSEVTGTSQTAIPNKGYIANNAALVTVTLPATASVGQIVAIQGKGAGKWKVAQNASQVIHTPNGNSTTGTGGSVSANNRYDAVELICITANTDWAVRTHEGSLLVV